jgi:hypothetical protein
MQSFSRRDFLAGAVSFGASAVVGAALPAFAEGEVAEVAVDLSKPPTDWALTKDYYAVCDRGHSAFTAPYSFCNGLHPPFEYRMPRNLLLTCAML